MRVSSDFIGLAVCAIVAVTYLLVFASHRHSVPALQTPWTYNQPYLQNSFSDFLGEVNNETVLALPTDLVCNISYQPIHPRFSFAPYNMSAACRCMYTLQNKPRENNRDLFYCLLGKTSTTEKFVYDRNTSYWTSNPFVLVATWNTVALLAHIYYILPLKQLRKKVPDETLHEKEPDAEWDIVSLLVSMITPWTPFGFEWLPFVATLGGVGSIVAAAAHIPDAITSQQIIIIFTFRLACIYVRLKSRSEPVSRAWIFWFLYATAVVIALVLWNLRQQHRDVLYMWVSTLAALAFTGTTVACNLFTATWDEFKRYKSDIVIRNVHEQLEFVEKDLGASYANIDSYATLSQIVLLVSFAAITYPTPNIHYPHAAASVAPVPLIILLAASRIRGVHHASTYTARFAQNAGVWIEMAARLAATAACTVDLLAAAR